MYGEIWNEHNVKNEMQKFINRGIKSNVHDYVPNKTEEETTDA